MTAINLNMRSVKAFAPATCANIAVGFDILGFAFAEIGDSITLTRRDDHKIIIESILPALSHEQLPIDPEKNTASAVIKNICQALALDIGFSIHIQKGIPLSSGMGGSAASAVAALIAFNAFLTTPLSLEQLVQYAMFGEEVASSHQHADNVVPCIFGGFTLTYALNPTQVIQLPIPKVHCILVHPHLYVPTKTARGILKPAIALSDHVRQSANLAAFIASLYLNDLSLWQKSLNDIVIEPQRAQFVPGFDAIKQAALDAGALGMSFSGSGPSMFAFADNKSQAIAIRNVMQEKLIAQSINSDAWITQISKIGAHVSHDELY